MHTPNIILDASFHVYHIRSVRIHHRYTVLYISHLWYNNKIKSTILANVKFYQLRPAERTDCRFPLLPRQV